MRRYLFPILFALCAIVTVLPLWVARHAPAVDIPQHLFLIHVLGNLGDPALPYSEIYVARPGLTYLSFYYTVRGLGAVLGLEAAMKLWLTLILVGTPASMLVLLRALGKSKWLSLLAFPLVYTDNFYWGLVSFQSSLPLTFLVMAFFIRALEVPIIERRRHLLALLSCGLSLLLLQMTHAAGMIFPAMALPIILLVTPSDWPRRLRAVGSLVPGVALFFAWLLSGVGKGRQFGAPGEPWKASAPLFDRANFVFQPLEAKLTRLPDLLGGGFWGYADRPALFGLVAVALLAVVLGLLFRPPVPPSWRGRVRAWLLFLLAVGCYVLLPQDITGYMYAICPRYAQVAALLVLPLLPFPHGPTYKIFAGAATTLALYAGGNLTYLFHQFDVEADNFEMVVKDIPPKAKVMHLVLDMGSRHATHSVYLHYAALAAQRVSGVPSFSLATDPSFPVGYKPGAQPPASPWEWRPLETNWAAMKWYDVYLARGDEPPETLFRGHAQDVELVSRADRWRLYRRKPGK